MEKKYSIIDQMIHYEKIPLSTQSKLPSKVQTGLNHMIFEEYETQRHEMDRKSMKIPSQTDNRICPKNLI